MSELLRQSQVLVKPVGKSIDTFRFQTVLLVDDNEIDNFIARRIMDAASFAKEIIESPSASYALNYLGEAAEGKCKIPDLIFLDIWMPLMNGFEFLVKFGAFGPEIISKTKVILLSSSVNYEDRRRASNHSLVLSLIGKPINIESLQKLKI